MNRAARLLGAVLGAMAFLLVVPPGDGTPQVQEAQAVIGRPLTPVSYAGVARRTTRRAVYATSAATTAATVATLPAGCAQVMSGGVVRYQCAGHYYRPVYDGPQVVYVVE